MTIGQRRGEVKFVGKAKELGLGYWVGVQLDEPTGDTNGTVNGTVLFQAPSSKFGIFVRPKEVEVGDFPAVDEFDEEADEI